MAVDVDATSVYSIVLGAFGEVLLSRSPGEPCVRTRSGECVARRANAGFARHLAASSGIHGSRIVHPCATGRSLGERYRSTRRCPRPAWYFALSNSPSGGSSDKRVPSSSVRWLPALACDTSADADRQAMRSNG